MLEDDLQDIPERRETAGNGWGALACAVVERAIDDLGATHRLLRLDAQACISGPGFAVWLELAGIGITPEECRAALRRRGFPV